MVSIPSALGCTVADSELLYCSTHLTISWLAAHSPVHLDTDYWWASSEDWTSLSRVKDLHYTLVAKRPLTKTPYSWLLLCISVPMSLFLL